MISLSSLSFIAICVGLMYIRTGRAQPAEEVTCGDVISLNEETLDLVSPGNYSSYPPNLDCSWVIQTSHPEDKIHFYLYEIMVDCGDGISLYDGSTASSSQLNSDLCTPGSPFSLTPRATSGQSLLTEFKTDETSKESEKGFYMSVIAGRDLSQCDVSGTTISLVANSSEQFITSPNFPQKYEKDFTCEWTIITEEPNSKIEIRFLFIDIDSDASSCYDNVKIFEGDSEVKEVCGIDLFLPGPEKDYQSITNQIRVVFTSDNIQEETGFKLSYREIKATTTTSTTTSTTSEPTTTTTTTTTSSSTTTTTTTPFTTFQTTTEDSIKGCPFYPWPKCPNQFYHIIVKSIKWNCPKGTVFCRRLCTCVHHLPLKYRAKFYSRPNFGYGCPQLS